jgi:nucleoside-diphosphate kinase
MDQNKAAELAGIGRSLLGKALFGKSDSGALPIQCYRNKQVGDFHRLLTSKGIRFPVAIDPDQTAEIASWAKSLFLSGKVGKKEKKYFMLTTRSSVKPDLKALAKVVGVKELRLASPADVSSILHIEKGCVTAMTSVMDKDCKVTCCLDEGLMGGTHLRMCAGCNDALDHSLHNISTCPPAVLKELLGESGHTLLMLDFSGGGPAVKITSGTVQAGAPAPAAPAPAKKEMKKEKKEKKKQQPTKNKAIPSPASSSSTSSSSAAVVAAKQTTAAERTYIMVKPDGVQRGCVGEIISRFEEKGFKLCALQLQSASAALLSEHYSDLSSNGFFASLVHFMGSAPVVAMVWEGAGVVAEGRKMLGATMPSASEMGTIRGDLCIDIGRNICHGSDSAEAAAAEIGLWFGGEPSLVEWAHHGYEWTNEATREAAALPSKPTSEGCSSKGTPISKPTDSGVSAATDVSQSPFQSPFRYPTKQVGQKTQLPNSTFQFPMKLQQSSRAVSPPGATGFSYPIK